MLLHKDFWSVISVLLIIVLFISGCTCGKPSNNNSISTAESRKPAGTITTGDVVLAASQQIPASGGNISVTGEASLLNGMELVVPSGSYDSTRDFKISYSPITKHTFGEVINPISPMITVENGGEDAETPMYVRVPVKIPDGHFAMGFYYDDDAGKITGMPLASFDQDSVTVRTQHFSDFFISSIEKKMLNKDIDSGFRPGIDDWQFTNMGSFIAPGGHCKGQSITAMWYYLNQPDGVGATLYGRYDNNGKNPKTPDFWYDDSLGYRFCSTVHKEIPVGWELLWTDISGIKWVKENGKWKPVDIPGLDDESTWYLFAYSMLVSKEPQMVSIIADNGSWHVMVCYRINKGDLYIADPNFPGNTERTIDFDFGEFMPYNSGANRAQIDAGKGTSYNKIIYDGNWSTKFDKYLASRWNDVKNGTAGDGTFPAFEIKYKDKDGNGQNLVDGYISTRNKIWIGYTVNLDRNIKCEITAYKGGGILNRNNDGTYELTPGNNQLGFLIQGEVNNELEYIGFKYFNIKYQEPDLTIDPKSLDGKTGVDYTFTAKTEPPVEGAVYEWFIDGDPIFKSEDASFQTRFADPGEHTVKVDLIINNEVLKSASIVANITGTTTPTPTQLSNLAKLQKLTYFKASFSSLCKVKFWNTAREETREEVSGGGIPWFDSGDDYRYVNINWNGTSFIGEYTSSTEKHKLMGSVSDDGTMINNLDYTYTSSTTKTEYGTTTEIQRESVIKLKDIPLGQSTELFLQGTDIQKYVTEFSLHWTSLQNGTKTNETTVVGIIWTGTGSSTKPKLNLGFYANP